MGKICVVILSLILHLFYCFIYIALNSNCPTLRKIFPAFKNFDDSTVDHKHVQYEFAKKILIGSSAFFQFIWLSHCIHLCRKHGGKHVKVSTLSHYIHAICFSVLEMLLARNGYSSLASHSALLAFIFSGIALTKSLKVTYHEWSSVGFSHLLLYRLFGINGFGLFTSACYFTTFTYFKKMISTSFNIPLKQENYLTFFMMFFSVFYLVISDFSSTRKNNEFANLVTPYSTALVYIMINYFTYGNGFNVYLKLYYCCLVSLIAVAVFAKFLYNIRNRYLRVTHDICILNDDVYCEEKDTYLIENEEFAQ